MTLVVRRPRRLICVLVLALVAALAAAVAAGAQTVVEQDDAGRSITFDVRAPNVDVDWYASLLRAAAHGDEISSVTIRIVPAAEIPDICGSGAVACYDRPLMVVPAGDDVDVAHSLLHEYGHHLDGAWPVDGARELNGTPVWWAARGMGALLAQRTVAYDYSLGWSHSIGEIFAEDYAYAHLGDSYGIAWLGPPDEALRAALLAELGGTKPLPPLAPIALPATPSRPVVVVRSGALAAGRHAELPFRLLGPGRHVTLSASVAPTSSSAARLRIEIVCDGTVVGTRTTTRRQRTVSLDLHGLGPANCEGVLSSTGRSTARYAVRLRLEVEQQRAR